MSRVQIIQHPALHEDNLIPLYLIEDKLKDNFRNSNSFMSDACKNFNSVFSKIHALEQENASIKVSFDKKMEEMEKKIIQEISLQLEGRIAIAVGKSIDSFTEKMDKKQKEMGDFKSEFQSKLEKIKQDIKYEVSQDSQKSIMKEGKRIDQSIKSLQKKIASGAIQVSAKSIPQQNASEEKKSEVEVEGGEGKNWQEQHEFMKSLEGRVQKLEDFSIGVDKRFYNSMSSLKQSWKELGAQLLENKKTLNKKMDDLRMELIKLKNLKQFSVAPDKVEETFQKKLAEKFTDIYQLLSVTLTKNQYNSAFERLNSRITRHDDEFIEIRKELAANNQFFTFYVNNADQEDLKLKIDQLCETVKDNREFSNEKDDMLKKNCEDNLVQLRKVEKNIGIFTSRLEEKIRTIDRVNEVVSLVEGRIDNLEDFNRFGPDKLETIHNALDGAFTATEKELISTKQKNTGMKDLKIEIGKMKDEMFIISSQNQIKEEELTQMKKMYHQIESRMEKMKQEAEEATLTRKPWVCLSCDKQDKQKESKKDVKPKKEPFKGFGTQRSSEKVLKAPPAQPFEERFEVYEKFREKYLSDAVKLPDIVRDKLKDREASFHT